MPWKDLRREERVPFTAPVILMWQDGGQTFEVRATAVDRSQNGVAVESWHALPVRAVQIGCLIPSLGALQWVSVRYSRWAGLKHVSGLEFSEPLPVR